MDARVFHLPLTKKKQNKTHHPIVALTSANWCKQWLCNLPLGNLQLPNVVLTSTTISGNNISLKNSHHHIIYSNNIYHLAITPPNCCNMWPFHLPPNKQYLFKCGSLLPQWQVVWKHFLQTSGSLQLWVKSTLCSKLFILLLRRLFDTFICSVTSYLFLAICTASYFQLSGVHYHLSHYESCRQPPVC